MPLSPGAKLGPYEVLALIGAGGMGEVYRAQDTRLGRTVAIKVCNQRFSDRFEREARTVASFNHPHICTVHDVGPDYLVMEYVEGETLASRMGRGQLPLDEALLLAAQIAGALDAAHRKGIVHRDLKPANIMLAKSGVKVVDFGIAKSAAAAGEEQATVTAITQAGAIVGTLNYMSPEQLEGKEADARSDIFSFGLVLYEMVTGRRAFQGDSAAAVIGAILHTEPAAAGVPESVSRLCLTCLAKQPDDRWQSARDLQRELEWVSLHREDGGARFPISSRRWKFAAVGCAVLVLILGALWMTLPPRREESVYHVAIRTPRLDLSDGGRIALSPDGRRIAMITVADGGQKQLMIRQLDSDLTQAVGGAEDPQNYPFWSPDGRSIGYFSTSSMNVVDLSSGKIVKLARTGVLTRGGSWANGQILFCPGLKSTGIHRISDTGGEPDQVTLPESGQHTYPQFLPDGKRFLFTAAADGKEELRLGKLGSRETRSLGAINGNVAVATASLLVFRHQETLVAQRVDPGTMAFIGPPTNLIDDIRFNSINGFGTFAVSNNGVLAFRRGGNSKTLLKWFDREGRPLSQIGSPGAYWSFDLSPDQTRISVSRLEAGQGESYIWVGDESRGPVSRLSNEDGSHPVWSPDGLRVAFVSHTYQRTRLLVQDASGAQDGQALSEGPARIAHLNWSPDGRFLAFTQFPDGRVTGRGEIGTISMESKKLLPLLTGTKSYIMPQFSADGHWLAYASDETGRFEVYVRPYPDLNRGKWQVSSEGGLQPRWRADGREIFFLAPDSRLVSVPVTSEGNLFQVGRAKPLFLTRVPFSLLTRFEYKPSRDGQRFLANILADEDDRSIDLFIHWDARLK